ncbi:MAG: hypothetical protein AAGI88_16955 [Pseudomonadota bacterium]
MALRVSRRFNLQRQSLTLTAVLAIEKGPISRSATSSIGRTRWDSPVAGVVLQARYKDRADN